MKVRQNYNEMYIPSRVQPEGGGSCRDYGGVLSFHMGWRKGQEEGKKCVHFVRFSFAGIASRFASVTSALDSRVPRADLRPSLPPSG